MRHILKCKACNEYTIQKVCACGKTAESPKPPKYSPEDNYGKYRREAKKESLEEKGLI